MSSIDTPYYRRYWILLLFRAATFSGLGTVSSGLFHRLVYFVNALMPSVGMKSETARVLKASYGPFFPDYQWDLDRLVGMRLLHVVDMEWLPNDQHFFGKYQITKKGVTLAEKVAASSGYFSDVERAISEIVSAFVANPRALTVVASRLDANLGQDTIREGQIVDFGEWQEENYSKQAADFLFEAWLRNVLNGKRNSATVLRVPTEPVGEKSDLSHEQAPAPGFENTPAYKKEEPIKSVLEPITPSPARRRAFHLYAHYLVQSLAMEPDELRRGTRV